MQNYDHTQRDLIDGCNALNVFLMRKGGKKVNNPQPE